MKNRYMPEILAPNDLPVALRQALLFRKNPASQDIKGDGPVIPLVAPDKHRVTLHPPAFMVGPAAFRLGVKTFRVCHI